MRQSSDVIRTSIVSALLVVIWLIFLHGAFDSDRLFSLYEDNEFLLGPVFSGISHILQSGAIPLRLDTILGGFPLYNFTQATPFYPFYGFIYGNYHGFLETLITLHNLTILHLLLMLVNMYYLLRTIGATIAAAITGAVFFTFGADMLAYAKWLNIIAPYSWLPLYIAGLIGIVNEKNIRINFALVLVSVCMIVTASPSQPLIHAALLTTFILAGHVVRKILSGRLPDVAVPLTRVFGIAIISGLVCAPLVIPASAEAGRMIRWIGNFPAIFLNERIPFEAFVYYKLPLEDFWRLFFYKAGGLVGGAYIGFFALPLIAFSFLRGVAWLPVTLVAAASYSLLSAFGDDLGFAYLNHQIPLLNKIREPSRNLALFQFSVAILAALGITNLVGMLRKGEPVGAKGMLLLTFSGLAVSFAFIYGFLKFRHGAHVENVFGGYQYSLKNSDVIRFWLSIILLLITAAAFRFRLAFLRHLAVFGWPIATIVSLFTAVSWQPPLTVSDSLYVRNNFAALEMAILDVRGRDQNSDYRILFDGDIDKGQAAMLAAYHGVRSFTYYINPAPIRQAVDFEWHGYTPFYSYQGAGYLICRRCDISQYGQFKLLRSYGEYQIYGDASAYPRVYAADVVGSFSDTKDFVKKVKAEQMLGSRRAYIEGATRLPIVGPGDSGNCSIKRLRESPNRTELLAACDPGVLIVLNEYNDGNWISSVNGRSAEVLRVNGNQNGIISSGGTQFITFEYHPKTFYQSIPLTVLGLLCFFSLLYIESKIERRKASQSNQSTAQQT